MPDPSRRRFSYWPICFETGANESFRAHAIISTICDLSKTSSIATIAARIRESTVKGTTRFRATPLIHLLQIVRQKAREVVGLLQDDEKIREERKKAKKSRDKYVGVSSDQFQRGYGKFLN